MADNKYYKLFLTQYCIGVSINIVYSLILLIAYSCIYKTPFSNNDIVGKLLNFGDGGIYIKLANNFLIYGVFGDKIIPNHDYAIGYSFFLAACIKIFGIYWFFGAIFLQSLLYGAVYPVLSKIALIFLPEDRSFSWIFFWLLVITGAYSVYSPIIMSDMFFVLFFFLGLYFGILSVIRQNWKYFLLQLLFISLSAFLRHSLFAYPIVNCFVMLTIARLYKCLGKNKVQLIIIFSFLFLMVTCNLSSVRNYLNFGFFHSSSLQETNMLGYLGKDVLAEENKSELYQEMVNNYDRTLNWEVSAGLRLAREYALSIYTSYPLTTIKCLLRNAFFILFNTHHNNIIYYLAGKFSDFPVSVPVYAHLMNYILAFNVIWWFFYLAVYLFFLYFLWCLFIKHRYFDLFTISLFILYFICPTFIAGGGPRLRIPVEGVILALALCGYRRLLRFPN